MLLATAYTVWNRESEREGGRGKRVLVKAQDTRTRNISEHIERVLDMHTQTMLHILPDYVQDTLQCYKR